MRMLVTLDGSAMSEIVLPAAVAMAERCRGEVLLYSVLHAADIAYLSLLPDRSGVPPPADETVVESEARLLRGIREMLTEKVKEFEERDIPASTETDVGDPASLIVDQARSWKADLIAMATHGRSGITEQLMGSVSSKVLRSAVAPVLLVCPPR